MLTYITEACTSSLFRRSQPTLHTFDKAHIYIYILLYLFLECVPMIRWVSEWICGFAVMNIHPSCGLFFDVSLLHNGLIPCRHISQKNAVAFADEIKHRPSQRECVYWNYLASASNWWLVISCVCICFGKLCCFIVCNVIEHI